MKDFVKTIEQELDNKKKDIKQLLIEYQKTEKKAIKLKSTALFGKIVLKDKKYYQFVSKMVKGERTKIYIGDISNCDVYERRLIDGQDLLVAQARMADIENQITEFYERVTNRYW